MTCPKHHPACACREHLVAVLAKAATDITCELDALKNFVPDLPPQERERITALVERGHDALDMLAEGPL